MTGWDTRGEIGLRDPRAVSTDINPTRGVAFHYAGGGTHRRSNHSDCRALWRAYQDWHLDPSNTNNYNDIAYNLGVCVHDIVLEGRSTKGRPRVRGGANGNATVNGNRYSICAIWGSGDGAPPADLKRAYLAARKFLRDEGGAGSGIAGHRDLSQTSCPGDPIYAWIRAGAAQPSEEEPVATPAQVWNRRDSRSYVKPDQSKSHQVAKAHQYSYAARNFLTKAGSVPAPGTEEEPRPSSGDGSRRDSGRYALQRIWRWAYWTFRRIVRIEARQESQDAKLDAILLAVESIIDGAVREQVETALEEGIVRVDMVRLDELATDDDLDPPADEDEETEDEQDAA